MSCYVLCVKKGDITPLIRLLQLNVIAAAFNLSQLNHSHLRFKCSGDLSMALELAHVEIDRGVIPPFPLHRKSCLDVIIW